MSGKDPDISIGLKRKYDDSGGKYKNDEKLMTAVRHWHEALNDHEKKGKLSSELTKAAEKAQQDCMEASKVVQELWKAAFYDEEKGKFFPKEKINEILEEYWTEGNLVKK